MANKPTCEKGGRCLYYDEEEDIEYWFNEKEVEIIAGPYTRREKDVDTIVLPIDSLTRFTCGLPGRTLVEMTEKASEEASTAADLCQECWNEERRLLKVIKSLCKRKEN